MYLEPFSAQRYRQENQVLKSNMINARLEQVIAFLLFVKRMIIVTLLQCRDIVTSKFIKSCITSKDPDQNKSTTRRRRRRISNMTTPIINTKLQHRQQKIIGIVW